VTKCLENAFLMGVKGRSMPKQVEIDKKTIKISTNGLKNKLTKTVQAKITPVRRKAWMQYRLYVQTLFSKPSNSVRMMEQRVASND